MNDPIKKAYDIDSQKTEMVCCLKNCENFLLLDEEARMIKFPCKDIGDIVVRRGVMAKPAEEYKELQENRMIHMIFGNLLPKYYQKGNSYRSEYKKNLYLRLKNI